MKKKTEKKKRKMVFTVRLSFMIVGFIAVLLFIYSCAMDYISYEAFNRAFKTEYDDSVFRVACTGTYLVNADSIDRFIETKGDDPEYVETKKKLELLRSTMGMSTIYIIRPESDYKHFVNVMNCLNPDDHYTPWEVGEVRETTSKKYEKAYKEIYEKKNYSQNVDRFRNLGEGKPHVTSILPLIGSDGEIKGLICVQRYVTELRVTRRSFMIMLSIATLLLGLVSIVTALLVMNKQVLKPLKLIEEEAEEFATNNEVAERKLTGRVSDVYEISHLADSVVEMEDDIRDYIAHITDITKEKERIGTELHLASKIQENTLPNIFPPFPERTEFDIYATMNAAKEVGGDFYDFFLVDEKHVGMVMADVSGKGIPAALFMMVTKILISEHSTPGLSPEEILTMVNQRICENNKLQMFVTAWLGILDVDTGVIKAVNAGHEDPAVYKKGESFELFVAKHGLPLGVRNNAKYTGYEIQLKKGDKLFLYTDGIPEADNEDGEMFGLDRMLEALNSAKYRDIRGVVEVVTETAKTFEGSAVQFDDMTMLCMEYIGKERE